jgi:hypothetical protein
VGVRFETTDPAGIRVRCSDETWDEHIVGTSGSRLGAPHPEMQGHEAWVAETIHEPTYIYTSAYAPNTKIYHRLYNFGGLLGHQFCRVVVEYNGRRFNRTPMGKVKTAFATTGAKQGEVQVWP